MNKLMIMLIDLFLLFTISSQFKIQKEFHFCKPTKKNIDFDVRCKDLNCVIYKNYVSILAKYNDEFNFVYKPLNEKIVVYSSEGQVFYTECEIINEIDIYELVEKCSSDVLVSFTYKDENIDGFLTKQGIIRKNTLFKPIDCPNDNLVIPFGLSNSKFDIFKKNNYISIAQRNTTLSEVDFETNSNIELIYNEFVSQNTMNKFLRDSFFSLSIISAIILTVCKNKLKIKILLLSFFKNFFSKKNKSLTVNANDLNFRTNNNLSAFKNSTLLPIYESTISELPRNQNIFAQNSNYKKSLSTSNIARNCSNETKNPITCFICGFESKSNAGLASHMKVHKNLN